MSEDPGKRMVYALVEECGCMAGMIMAKPEGRKRTRAVLTEWLEYGVIEIGMHLEYITLEAAQKRFTQKCEKHMEGR